jgi:hypothetical protein
MGRVLGRTTTTTAPPASGGAAGRPHRMRSWCRASCTPYSFEQFGRAIDQRACGFLAPTGHSLGSRRHTSETCARRWNNPMRRPFLFVASLRTRTASTAIIGGNPRSAPLLTRGALDCSPVSPPALTRPSGIISSSHPFSNRHACEPAPSGTATDYGGNEGCVSTFGVETHPTCLHPG